MPELRVLILTYKINTSRRNHTKGARCAKYSRDSLSQSFSQPPPHPGASWKGGKKTEEGQRREKERSLGREASKRKQGGAPGVCPPWGAPLLLTDVSSEQEAMMLSMNGFHLMSSTLP